MLTELERFFDYAASLDPLLGFLLVGMAVPGVFAFAGLIILALDELCLLVFDSDPGCLLPPFLE